MQFFSRRNASLALSLAAVGVLAACGDDVTVPVVPPDPVVISISPPSVTLNPGGTATFSVQITGGEPTPTLASCASDNSGVATAAVSGSSCTVTAVASGSTTITASTSTGQSASAAVTVSQLPSALGDLTVSPNSAALSVGQTVTLVPNANPAGSGVTTTYTYVSSSSAIASVNASGVVTAAAPGTATITVTATGSGTGFTAATRTFGVTINVSSAPPALTALTVSPAALTVATGGSAQLTSAVTQPAGATAAVITYESSNPSVATVAGSGANATVTAVTPGTATITVTATAEATSTLSATTLTQLVPVTVAALPVVSIEAVTQGPIVTTGLDSTYDVSAVVVGTPAGGPSGPATGVIAGIRQALNPQLDQSVDIANTKDQIQVRLNLNTNGANIDSVVVYIDPATAGERRAAARQINPQAGQLVTGYINTADFDLNPSTGVADVYYANGLKEISASVWITLPADSPAGACPTAITAGNTCEIQNAANNRQSFNFNNIDGFALQQQTPANHALDAAQRSWWGGPTVSDIGQESGLVSFQVWPVIYTPNRTIERLSATFGLCNGFGLGGLPTGVEKVGAPYKFTAGTAAGTDAEATHISCANLTGAYDGADNYRFEDYPMVTYSLDNSANPGPRSIYAYNPTLGTDVFAGPRPSLYRQSAQVQSPNAIRVDYRGPTVAISVPGPSLERWVNDTWSFADGYTAGDFNSGAVSAAYPGPVGVGLFDAAQRTDPRVWFAYASRNTCAGPQAFVKFGSIGSTVADLPSIEPNTNREHPCDFTNDAYAIQASETDRLGNRSTTATTVGTAPLFGVDNTAPELTVSYDGTGPIPDTPDHYLATGDSIFQGGGATATPIAASQANPTDFYFGARYRDTRSGFNITNHGSRTVRRYAPNATPLFTNVAVLTTVSSRTMTFAGGIGNPVENEDPTFRRDSVTIYGHGPIANNAVGGLPLVANPAVGYYQYDLVLTDRAGNSSSLRQRAVIDSESPVITGVQIPSVIGATGTGTAVAQTFRPTGTDDVEAIDADMFWRYPALAVVGDANDNSLFAASSDRLRFRRNLFADNHAPWAVFEDGLLATPFGPGAALSDAGMTMPIPTIRGIESVDSTDSPIDWAASGVTRTFTGFKPNQIGLYAFDVRASREDEFPVPYNADLPYVNHGMSNMAVGDESAYIETLFPGIVSNGSRWAVKDFGTPATGFVGLVTWHGFSSTGTSVSFRANTNSVSSQPIFPSVYLVRWEADAQHTGSGETSAETTVADTAPGQWVYIGEIKSNAPSNPALFDQGSTRTWQYTFTIPAVTNGRIVQDGTNSPACYRAIGVDASGDGIATKPFAVGGAVCPAVALAAPGVDAAVTFRAYGPGAGIINATSGAAFTLTKSAGANGLVRASQNRADGVETYVVTPGVGSTLQVAPTGCSTVTAPAGGYPTSLPVTCTVNAGFGTRHITAIFDHPSIP